MSVFRELVVQFDAAVAHHDWGEALRIKAAADRIPRAHEKGNVGLWMELESLNWSAAEIGKRFGVSRETVQTKLNAAKAENRTDVR